MVKLDQYSHLVPLLLRIGLGLIFLFSGYAKVAAPSFAAGMFMKIGFPIPELIAPVISWFELLGGAALVLGLGTRILGLLFTIEMIVAIITVQWPAATTAAFEYNQLRTQVLMIACSLSLAFAGPGQLSIDHLTGLEQTKP